VYKNNSTKHNQLQTQTMEVTGAEAPEVENAQLADEDFLR